MENSSPKNFEFGQVMSMLESMDDGIKLVGEQHGEIVKRLDGLEGKFDRMQEDITEIKHRLAEKAGREEFEKLEKRVVKTERLVLAKTT
jgi:hypothetical protein